MQYVVSIDETKWFIYVISWNIDDNQIQTEANIDPVASWRVKFSILVLIRLA